jgi:uncharacterized protein YjiS (DUF1127 family)
MALSLPGERSIAAASPAHPFRFLAGWYTRLENRRARNAGLKALLTLDATQLRDLGISRADIAEAMRTGTPGVVLNAARARQARL